MEKQLTWGEFLKRFLDLTKKSGGPSKSSSGSIHVHFDYTWGENNELIPQILIEMGTYDIANYPRHYTFGKEEGRYGPIPFTSEEEALKALDVKLNEMEIEVQKDLSYIEEEEEDDDA